MAEDFDVEAMLEAPYVANSNGVLNYKNKTENDDRYDDKYAKKPREEDYSPRKLSPLKEDKILEEADQRTIFCMQLSARVRPRDLEEFFSKAGKVREVRLIMDNKTRKHKGIAYIEFRESSSVSLALQFNGQKLCGYPIMIQPTQAEKNRSAVLSTANSMLNSHLRRHNVGPMRLYVGSLHFNITEDMLKGIFEPFGTIQKIELMRDPETFRSKGYGFVTFYEPDEAKKALEQLNGFELAGRPMKVNYVTERTSDCSLSTGQATLDSDELDRTGIDLGTTGRLQLMAKLAEGTGIELPKAAVKALNQYSQVGNINSSNGLVNNCESAETISTQCFMLTNMFDPSTEEAEDWPNEIKSEVVDECRKHGGALHVYVDAASQGNVFVKASSIASAVKCVATLHGRWFSGKLVTAAYVPIASYHQLFPDSIAASTPL
ncbi:hypothetical protein RND71_044221 [Anisodus tanguticus]|uniref:RRM domain-containing protein n=1 Tax=Anisodus tanguticus TaxID=243964 RepID=A0AAE1ULX3_9SOLA|nr:hypothetical protein RND71_044221 [Anisodus tanguticus]